MSEEESLIPEMNMSFSELIVLYRGRFNLSQSELAKSVGVSRNYISLIERGRTDNVSYKVVKNICLALGLKIRITSNQPSFIDFNLICRLQKHVYIDGVCAECGRKDI